MTSTTLADVQQMVFEWIRDVNRPVTTNELLQQRAAQPIGGEALRRAVWNLVDDGRVRFDDQWRLSVR